MLVQHPNQSNILELDSCVHGCIATLRVLRRVVELVCAHQILDYVLTLRLDSHVQCVLPDTVPLLQLLRSCFLV